MSDVVILPVVTRLDVPAERILDSAKHLERVVVMGYEKDGTEYFASSIADGGDILWLVERFKRALLEVSEDEIER